MIPNVVAVGGSWVAPRESGAPSAVRSASDAATAPVHPGVQTITNGGQCTSNFVFYSATAVYIGQAAPCSGTGAPTDTTPTSVTFGKS